MELVVNDLPSTYHHVVRAVTVNGTRAAPRGEATLEVLDFSLFVRDTHHVLPVGTGRGVSKHLADEQALQVLAGVYLPERFAFDETFVDDPLLERYGPLLAPGIERSLAYLRADPFTRRAVANMGHTGGDSGYPCTVSLGWLLREGHLHAFVEMRSNDAWLGLPYDLHVFASLQHTMASCLGVKPGPLHHHVRSLHVYERNLQGVAELHPSHNVRLHPVVNTADRGGSWHDVQRRAEAVLAL